ncbi:MAG: hypothetical protein ABIG89_03690 [Candidatus Woesearchaeota archaeon]
MSLKKTLTVKVPKKEANKIKIRLIKDNNLPKEFKIISDKNYIYFPINKRFKTMYEIIAKEMETSEIQVRSLKEALSKRLTKEELERLKTAYDSLGEIAILEIDEELRDKEKLIGKTLLNLRADIKTVLRKEGSHEGVFRTQKMIWLAGKKNKIAVHKENNVKLKLNIETVYFSPRLSTERKRISQLVGRSKRKENILVMFSGCAPYPCVIARNAKEHVDKIIGIEINPEGHRYGLENVKLNNTNEQKNKKKDGNKICKKDIVELINGDVKKEIPKLAEKNMKFDRILMPLPKHAENFLEDALIVSKKGTMIHFYNFLHEKEFDNAKKMIKKACDKAKKKHRILRLVKCGQHSPHVFRICIDFEIL